MARITRWAFATGVPSVWKFPPRGVLRDIQRPDDGAHIGVRRPVDGGEASLVRLELRTLQVRLVQVRHGAVLDEYAADVRDQDLLGILEHLGPRRRITRERGRLLDEVVVLGVL